MVTRHNRFDYEYYDRCRQRSGKWKEIEINYVLDSFFLVFLFLWFLL